MVKRYGFRGTLAIKYKIDFWNNPITDSVLVWNQVVLNQSQQLGYLNSKLMLSWDCPFKASLQPLSGVIKLTLPIETPVIHVQLSGRVGGTLPHKSYSSLSWVDQTANGHLHGQSPRSGFAVIGPFEPMPAGTGISPPRCHPPPNGGTLRHVNNSLPGPLSEGSVHGNGSRQPDNWLSALAEPFVTVLAHGNGVAVFTHIQNLC